MKELTPRQIVAELDKYIIGQDAAKKSVAIAIRNRWRRQQLDEDMREEVAPKNIIMMGPTGVGKTEIARRLANLVKAPFLKVEASKYTEVGYHGRDVESMIRDIVELSMNMVRAEQLSGVQEKADVNAEESLLDLLLPPSSAPETETGQEYHEGTREKLRQKLRDKELEERMVELNVEERGGGPGMIVSNVGFEELGVDLQSMMDRMLPSRSQRRKVPIKEARMILQQQEAEKLIDREQITREALQRVENSGIIFLDELDKVAGSDSGHGPDVSRQGVQRDMLPIVEGSTVATRYGMVRTDHILFVAAGAFTIAKPSDLMPELQGRFPIRVELDDLDKDDFIRILTEPENALIKQYIALLKTENVAITFEQDAIDELAEMAATVNQRTQNIGARRLHTVVERLLEDISFDAPDNISGAITIDRDYVRTKLESIMEDEDLSMYIL